MNDGIVPQTRNMKLYIDGAWVDPIGRNRATVINPATEERIAKIAIDTSDEPPLKPLVDLPRMAVIGREMLSESITAYIEGDADLARRVAARDDEVDDLTDQVFRELLTYMLADPTTINRATRLLWVSHNLERIADRATNICERVVFAVTGAVEEINVSTY